jgi:hypothetical protein
MKCIDFGRSIWWTFAIVFANSMLQSVNTFYMCRRGLTTKLWTSMWRFISTPQKTSVKVVTQLVAHELDTFWWYHIDVDNCKCTLFWWHAKEHKFLTSHVFINMTNSWDFSKPNRNKEDLINWWSSHCQL